VLILSQTRPWKSWSFPNTNKASNESLPLIWQMLNSTGGQCEIKGRREGNGDVIKNDRRKENTPHTTADK